MEFIYSNCRCRFQVANAGSMLQCIDRDHVTRARIQACIKRLKPSRTSGIVIEFYQRASFRGNAACQEVYTPGPGT